MAKSTTMKAALFAATVFLAQAASAVLVLDVTGGTAGPCGSCGSTTGQTFGWEFDLSSSITIDGLGAWDAGADGIGPAVGVGLWNSTGTLLRSTVVSDASDVEGSSGPGAWLFEDVASLVLGPGRYRLGQVFFASTPLAQLGATPNLIPEVSLVRGLFSTAGPNSGLTDPTDTFGPIFGPNLRLAEVPEPAVLSLLGLGLAGLGFRRKAS